MTGNPDANAPVPDSELDRLAELDRQSLDALLAMLAEQPRWDAELVAWLFDENRQAAELAELLAVLTDLHDSI